MRQASIYAVAGWAISFGLLFAATLWLTAASFEAALHQQQRLQIEALVKEVHQRTVYPDTLPRPGQ